MGVPSFEHWLTLPRQFELSKQVVCDKCRGTGAKSSKHVVGDKVLGCPHALTSDGLVCASVSRGALAIGCVGCRPEYVDTCRRKSAGSAMARVSAS